MSELMTASWFLWGLGLLAVFPSAIIGINELAEITRTGRWSAYANPLSWLRNAVLPLLFIDLLLRLVAGYDSTHLAVRIADTAFWVVIINFALAATNVAYFGDGDGTGVTTRVPKLLLDLARIFLVLVATSIIVSTVWGVDLGSLLTALGVGSLVIGLALQDTLGSVFSGIAMLSTRQVRVGDYVSAGGEEGVLTNMNWRTVTIRTGTGDDVVFPNSVVSREKVTVIGAGSGKRMASADVLVAYDHPPETVLALMVETARQIPSIATDPAPVARLTSYDAFAIHYTLSFTATEIGKASLAKHEFLSTFWYACEREGIVFPGRYHVDHAIPPERRGAPPPSADALAHEIETSGALPRPAAALASLTARGQRRTYRGGEIVMRHGAPLESVLFVTHGRASAVHPAGPDSKLDLDEFATGQIILFKSAFRSGTVPYTIEARETLTCVAVPLADFKTLLATDLALARELERTLSARDARAVKAIQSSDPGSDDAGIPDRERYLKDMFRS